MPFEIRDEGDYYSARLSGILDRADLNAVMEEVERLLLTEALRDHGNNKTKTADALGITREGLHKKLSKYGMS